jgi:hypothetical protein
MVGGITPLLVEWLFKSEWSRLVSPSHSKMRNTSQGLGMSYEKREREINNQLYHQRTNTIVAVRPLDFEATAIHLGQSRAVVRMGVRRAF